MDSTIITTAEAALVTHLPEGTLRYYRHCNLGPPSFKLGRRVMYRRADLIAWIADQETADQSRRLAGRPLGAA